MRIRIAISVAALLWSLAVAATTPPAGTGTTPLDYTRATLQQTRVIIDSDKTHNQKLAALHDLLTEFLDTDTMGRNALDKHWSEFSKSQQKEFLELFRELFQRTYVQKLLLFDRPDFEYVGQKEMEDYVRVDTLILTPRDEFAVTYQFRPTARGWRASDIQIEDLSLTTNFRRQLDQLLTKSSVENVLARMRRKYGSGNDD
jgi:phospholipid transport system substrate-binding protein